jgi:hypothetical protein
MGQLSALISSSLSEPLSRIGVTEVADDETLAVMRGDGPHEGEGNYACNFHCYPIEATDPASGMPRDDENTFSLPPNALPGALAPVDGARVMLVVGPKSPGLGFVRVIPAVRTFDGLVACVSSATKLSADDTRRWFDVAKRHAAS